MSKAPLIFLFFIAAARVIAQPISVEDSLRNVIQLHKGDTAEVNALALLGYNQAQLDSADNYLQNGILLAQQLGYKKGEGDCLLRLGQVHLGHGNFSQSIQHLLNSLTLYEDLNDIEGIVSAHLMLQAAYRETSDYRNALKHAFLGEEKAKAYNIISRRIFPGHRVAPLLLAEIGQTYVLANQLDSASLYTRKAIDQKELFNGSAWNFPVYLLATIQSLQGEYDASLKNYHEAKSLAIKNGLPSDTLQILSGMSTLFIRTGRLDSAIVYSHAVAHSWQKGSEVKNLMEAVSNLHKAYRLKGNKDSTLKYIELDIALKDSLYSKEKDREIQNITFSERLKDQQFAAAQARYESRLQMYSLVAGLVVLIVTVVLLWRNNRQKQKAKTKIEKAYADLEATQAQLIQSAKMASLGELTAGIAHEIQNPMNFINNFSEVNAELIDEMQKEMIRGNLNEAKTISNSIRENEAKIAHHGKRADAIVKGMLLHSRQSSGVKEPTDINTLTDECLRLAYHGFRAKNKAFNAAFKTNFDLSLSADKSGVGTVNIVSGDIGRVVLNLINNAFYAVSDKSAKVANETYEPTVTVGTKRLTDKVMITVSDNGDGIDRKVLDKIFQPFFTTKPAGHGTGLGLSLSYDIVKAHGGELKVETKEKEGTSFIILLPL